MQFPEKNRESFLLELRGDDWYNAIADIGG
jgi:hypothetical protein